MKNLSNLLSARWLSMGIGLLILLLNLSVAKAQKGKADIKIISYNILQGMRSDTTEGKQRFVSWIKKNAPDVLALQEVTGFTQSGLESLARAYGHPYAALLIEGEKYPVAITSKYPVTNVRKVTDNMDRGFIQADILGQTFVVLHLSPFDYRTRKIEIDLVLANVHSQPHIKNWILLGDFNSFSPVDSDAYTDGRLIANLKKYEEKYSPIKKLIDGKIDFSTISTVLENGFYDALKVHHKGFVKTVHPKKFHPPNGPDVPTRIDYVFVSKTLKNRVKSAEVMVDEFTDQYSDHYPMFTELSLPGQ